jgi:hypothetical protein
MYLYKDSCLKSKLILLVEIAQVTWHDNKLLLKNKTINNLACTCHTLFHLELIAYRIFLLKKQRDKDSYSKLNASYNRYKIKSLHAPCHALRHRNQANSRNDISQHIRPFLRPLYILHNKCNVSRWGLLAPRPTPKLEGYPLSAVPHSTF